MVGTRRRPTADTRNERFWHFLCLSIFGFRCWRITAIDVPATTDPAPSPRHVASSLLGTGEVLMGLNKQLVDGLRDHPELRRYGTEFFDRVERLERERLEERDSGIEPNADSDARREEDEFLRHAAFRFRYVDIMACKVLRYPSARNEELRNLARAGAHRAFGLERLLPIASKGYERLHDVLCLSSLAVCGGRREDLLQWYSENERVIAVPRAPGIKLDLRFLYKNYDCWLRLFRGEGEQDLRKVQRVIEGMVKDQAKYEDKFFDSLTKGDRRAAAMEMMSHYIWSSATSRFIKCLLEPGSREEIDEMDEGFEAAMDAADMYRHRYLVVLLGDLHAAAKTMIHGRHS